MGGGAKDFLGGEDELFTCFLGRPDEGGEGVVIAVVILYILYLVVNTSLSVVTWYFSFPCTGCDAWTRCSFSLLQKCHAPHRLKN